VNDRSASAHEAFQETGISRRDFMVEGFDRNDFPRLSIRGAVNIAHPTAAEQIFFKIVDGKALGDGLVWAHALSPNSASSSAIVDSRSRARPRSFAAATISGGNSASSLAINGAA